MKTKRKLVAGIVLALGLGAPAHAATVFTDTFETGTAKAQIGGGGSVEDGQGYKGKGGFADYMLRSNALGNPAPATTLMLAGLAAHTAITIAFDLAFIDSWDSTDAGNDFFNLSLDGVILLRATAANASGTITGLVFGSATFIETVAPQELGFVTGTYFNQDRGFRVEYTVAHTAASATYSFFADGSGWQGGDDESWGIDNVTVSIAEAQGPAPVPLPAGLPLLITALSAVALMRSRRG